MGAKGKGREREREMERRRGEEKGAKENSRKHHTTVLCNSAPKARKTEAETDIDLQTQSEIGCVEVDGMLAASSCGYGRNCLG